MAKLTINTGTSAGAGNGDTLYTAFNKINENFTELYTLTGNNSTAAIKDIQGSVFGDDSVTLVNGVSSSINLDGTVKGNIVPDIDEAYDLGSSSKKFKDLYLKGTTINLGTQTISATGSGITTSGTLTATAVTTTAPSTLSGTFTGDVTGSVFADDSGTLIDGVAGKVVGPVENATVTTSLIETGSITNTTQPQMSITSTDGALILSNTNLGNPGAGVGSDIEITSMSNAVAIRGEAYVSVTSGPLGGPYADLDMYGGPITLHGNVLFGSGATIDFGNATVSNLNSSRSISETATVDVVSTIIGDGSLVGITDDTLFERIILDIPNPIAQGRFRLENITTPGKIVSFEIDPTSDVKSALVELRVRNGYGTSNSNYSTNTLGTTTVLVALWTGADWVDIG